VQEVLLVLHMIARIIHGRLGTRLVITNIFLQHALGIIAGKKEDGLELVVVEVGNV
jgi:hypothetical protein